MVKLAYALLTVFVGGMVLSIGYYTLMMKRAKPREKSYLSKDRGGVIVPVFGLFVLHPGYALLTVTAISIGVGDQPINIAVLLVALYATFEEREAFSSLWQEAWHNLTCDDPDCEIGELSTDECSDSEAESELEDELKLDTATSDKAIVATIDKAIAEDVTAEDTEMTWSLVNVVKILYLVYLMARA